MCYGVPLKNRDTTYVINVHCPDVAMTVKPWQIETSVAKRSVFKKYIIKV